MNGPRIYIVNVSAFAVEDRHDIEQVIISAVSLVFKVSLRT